MKLSIYTLGTLLLATIIGCQNDDEGTNFDVEQMRSDLIEQVETPATNRFVDDVNTLDNVIDLLVSDPTENTLKNVQQQWKATSESFAKIETWNIGEINKSFIHFGLYSWGTNEAYVENYINSTDEISSSKFSGIPTNARGLSAIEYLIFGGTDQELLDQLQNTRRLNYLKAVSESLVIKSQELKDALTLYRPEFINNNSSGIEGSVNMLINQMNALLETVNKSKIGEPAGIVNDIISSKALQADISETSLTLISANLEGVKMIYFGQSNGIDDQVTAMTGNQELNNSIQDQFDKIEQVLTSFTGSLVNAIDENNLSNIETLYEEINQLIILIRVDLTSILSITITPTDNDGD